MKNFFQLSILLALFSYQAFSQISFDPGYIINSEGVKQECLVENKDWLNNPTNFNYKQPDGDTVFIGDLNSIQEFAIGSELKYVRAIVKIDRSSGDLENLSLSRNPEFQTETLFLKVLVEGDADLFAYTEKNMKRFFFSVNEGPVTQLVYKNYYVSKSQMGENNLFRQQLLTELTCQNFTANQVKSINYSRKELLKYFINHNNCMNSANQVYQKPKQKKTYWTLEGSLIASSLKVEYSSSSLRNMQFDQSFGYGVGVEIEHLMSFNKNKWSVVFEPNYNSLKSSSESDNYKAKLTYNTLSLPIGIRYSFYLKNSSRIFISTAIGIDVAFNSSVKYEDGPLLDLKGATHGSFGAGIKLKRWLIEAKYYLPHQLGGQYSNINLPKSDLRFSLGYTLF